MDAMILYKEGNKHSPTCLGLFRIFRAQLLDLESVWTNLLRMLNSLDIA